VPDILKVRDIQASLGEKKFGWMKIGETMDGKAAEIPIALINGRKHGPTVYLQAAVDGDELNPIGVIRRIISKLDANEISGSVIAVMIANYFGFHSNSPWNPIDMLSMNRVWPGRENGSSSERIVSQLWNEIVLQSNYAIDIHQTGIGPSVGSVYVRVAKDEPHHDEAFEMARIFGSGYILDEKESKIYASDSLNPKSAETKLSWRATVRGIPTITPELSGSLGWVESSIQKGMKGVENVLRHLKVLPGEPSAPESQYVVHQLKTVLSPCGGFLEFEGEPGTIFEKGTKFVRISDPFGNVKESLAVDLKSLLWRISEYPMVASGQYVATLATDINKI
jgi:predicted deacylase